MSTRKVYVLDLFCGAGGTSTAISESNTNIEVVACINHDRNAILSHTKNHPNCIHYIEDIRTIDINPIVLLLNKLRVEDPTCLIAIWASLECTNFSRAKCGPKDADSRTLAKDIFRYLQAIRPDFLWIENVEEFRLWGPLDAEGNPDKSQLGLFYNDWKAKLCNTFFTEEHFDETLVSADFGGRTIRKRLFLQFSKYKGLLGTPIKTHSKENGSWLPVKDVLDLRNYGASIFTRKKPLVANTHRRIFKGLVKFNPADGTEFGYKYYGQDGFVDVVDPCCTLTTKDRVSLVNVKAVCIKQDFGNSDSVSIDKPFPTLTAVPKGDIIYTKHISFLHSPQYGGQDRSIDIPAATLIARQDKAPTSLSTVVSHDVEAVIKHETDTNLPHIRFENGVLIYAIFETDDEWMVKIKHHMFDNNLLDVCIRPLTIQEMLSIQGFPVGYELVGTQTEQKKYIGNSVEVNVGIALFKAIDSKIKSYNF
jgi:DNA (cytosine-5)-methyltransferase 1